MLDNGRDLVYNMRDKIFNIESIPNFLGMFILIISDIFIK